MAHNLNFNTVNNKYALYARKDVAWHGLGQIVEEAKNSDEVIKFAQLDWNVEKCPVFTKYPETSNFLDKNQQRIKGTIVNNLHATVRMDNGVVLGSCTDRYEVVQNSDAFKFIDNIVGEKLAIYETAGALHNGEVIFVTAKLPSFIQPTDNKDDIINQYILFTTSHDGSGSIRAMFTPIRVVCNNTLNQALRNNTNKVVFKHTKNVQSKLNEARQLMNLCVNHGKKLQFDLSMLAQTKVDDKIIDSVLANVFLTSEQLGVFNTNGNILLHTDLPKKTVNQLITVKNFIEEGSGQLYSRGTAYWLYNGITDFVGNGKEYGSSEDRFKSIVEGWGADINQKAFNQVLTLV